MSEEILNELRKRKEKTEKQIIKLNDSLKEIMHGNAYHGYDTIEASIMSDRQKILDEIYMCKKEIEKLDDLKDFIKLDEELKISKEIKENDTYPQIDSDISQIKNKLKETADRMAEYKSTGFYEQEAGEHAEFNKLTNKLRELNVERDEIKNKLDNKIKMLEEKKECSEIESKIANMEMELKASADRMAEYKRSGFYEQEAREHSIFNELTIKLGDLNDRKKYLSSRYPNFLTIRDELGNVINEIKENENKTDKTDEKQSNTVEKMNNKVDFIPTPYVVRKKGLIERFLNSKVIKGFKKLFGKFRENVGNKNRNYQNPEINKTGYNEKKSRNWRKENQINKEKVKEIEQKDFDRVKDIIENEFMARKDVISKMANSDEEEVARIMKVRKEYAGKIPKDLMDKYNINYSSAYNLLYDTDKSVIARWRKGFREACLSEIFIDDSENVSGKGRNIREEKVDELARAEDINELQRKYFLEEDEAEFIFKNADVRNRRKEIHRNDNREHGKV